MSKRLWAVAFQPQRSGPESIATLAPGARPIPGRDQGVTASPSQVGCAIWHPNALTQGIEREMLDRSDRERWTAHRRLRRPSRNRKANPYMSESPPVVPNATNASPDRDPDGQCLSPDEIGQMLRKRRQAQGLSRPQAARIAGINACTLREHERGRGLDAVASLLQYCASIGVEVSFRSMRHVVTHVPHGPRRSTPPHLSFRARPK